MANELNDLLAKIKGQGNQVDLGGVLPILLGNVANYKELNDYEQFNEDVSYSAGAVVRYDGLLYRFVNNHIGDWNEADVVPTNLTELLGVVPIAYRDLKKLRDENKLIAGTRYRITDYVCTTKQEDTQAQVHRFDIIVTALSENVLSEEAQAIEHDGEDYFKTQHLNAWKLWYCLDNDNERFKWAKEDEIELNDNGTYMRYKPFDENGHWAWIYATEDERDYDDVAYTDPNPVAGSPIYTGTHQSMDLTTDTIVAVHHFGAGVIYRMIDDWGNDLPYDFKNIQFKRTLADGNYDPDGEETWVYTFNWYDENGDCHDASIIGNDGTLLNDDKQISGVYGNVMKPYMDYEGFPNPKATKQFLNNNVFLSCNEYDIGYFYGCYSNTFGNNCYNNTFGNNCYSNTFGNDCYSNRFGDDCVNNTFGKNCNSNIFGNDCDSNTFGNNCYSNTFGNNCYGNTFEYECYSNTFGNNERFLTIFEGVNHCNISGGAGARDYVQYAQILNGTKRISGSNLLQISFAQNKSATQVAGLNSQGVLKIWYPADNV